MIWKRFLTIIGSIFAVLILTAMHVFVFLGYNGELRATVYSFDVAYLSAFLYMIIDLIKKSAKVETETEIMEE